MAGNSVPPADAAPKEDSSEMLINVILVSAILLILLWKALEGHIARWTAAAPKKNGTSSDSFFKRSEPPEPAYEEPDLPELSDHEEGEELELPVDQLHFGLPRCRIMAPGLDPMPKMLKWDVETFGDHQLEVARIRIGTFAPWVVQGMRSNRLVYAMKKRGDVDIARCVVVPPPPPRKRDDEDDQEFPDEHGSEIGRIQLIP